MGEGGRSIRIGDVREGDRVMSCDVARRRVTSDTVVRVRRGRSDRWMAINGGRLEVTEPHMLYLDILGAWVRAIDVRPGDRLVDEHWNPIQVRTVRRVREPRQVFNLKLATTTGMDFLANGLLVAASVADFSSVVGGDTT